MKRLHAAVNFVWLELGGLVDHHTSRCSSGVSASVEVERSRHDSEHLRSRQERIVALNINLVRVIGDELEPRPLGIEYLTAAGHKTWPLGFHRSNSIGESDVGGFGIDVRKFPGNPTSLCVEREADSPHDARATGVGQGTVLSY